MGILVGGDGVPVGITVGVSTRIVAAISGGVGNKLVQDVKVTVIRIKEIMVLPRIFTFPTF